MTLSESLLESLCARAPVPAECPDVAAWWPRHLRVAREWPVPVERSIAGGLDADRAGWAFAAGYQAALHAMLPGLADDAIAALCVTEEGGNRPSAIRTTLRDAGAGRLRLDGGKRWTTLGPASAVLLVAALDARGGEARGAASGARPRIRVARVAAHAPGVSLSPMPDTGFVPEVPHARVGFAAVELDPDCLLPGDGYDGYVKPFRTVEDSHVTAALLAYLLAEGRRRDWPRAWCERAIATLLTLATVAAMDPRAAPTHLALAGALGCAHALFDEGGVLFARDPRDPAARRWARDAALLRIATAAREQRAARAWERADAISRPPPSA